MTDRALTTSMPLPLSPAVSMPALTNLLCTLVLVVGAMLQAALLSHGQARGSVMVFVLLGLAVLAAALLSSRDWLGPKVMTLLCLCAYALPMPAAMLWEPGTRYDLTMRQMAGTCLALTPALAAVFIAAMLPLPRAWLEGFGDPSRRADEARRAMAVYAAIIVPTLACSAILQWRSGYFDMSYVERLAVRTQGSASLISAALVAAAYGSVAFAPVAWDRSTSRLLRIAWACMPVGVIVLATMLMSRRFVVTVALGLLIAFHACVRRLPRVALAAAGVMMIVIVLAAQFARGGALEQAQDLWKLVSPSRHDALRNLHVSLHESKQWLAADGPLWGASYFNSYRILLPRPFVDRPMDGEAKYNPDQLVRQDPAKWFSRTQSLARFRIGHDYGFPSPAEAHLNFGALGPPLLMLVVVVMLRVVYAAGERHALAMGLYALLAGTLFWLLRSPLAHAGKALLVFFVAPLAVAWLSAALLVAIGRSRRAPSG